MPILRLSLPYPELNWMPTYEQDFDQDLRLIRYHLKHIQKIEPEWCTRGPKWLDMLQELFSQRSLTNFYEVMAQNGFKGPVHRFLESYNATKRKIECVRSHFLWRHLENGPLTFETGLEWILPLGVDLKWADVHRVIAEFGTVYQMLTFVEGILFRAKAGRIQASSNVVFSFLANTGNLARGLSAKQSQNARFSLLNIPTTTRCVPRPHD
jgi:hypothetical protein